MKELHKVHFDDFQLLQRWFDKYKDEGIKVLNVERYDVTKYILYYIGEDYYYYG